MGSETCACTALDFSLDGVQQDGGSGDSARREDDVCPAALQRDWTARGIEDACNHVGVISREFQVTDIESFDHDVGGNHQWVAFFFIVCKLVLVFVDCR